MFGLTLSVLAFCLGRWVQKKTKFVLCNPLLIAVACIIIFLSVTGIPYADFAKGGDIINMMLGPVTAVLALNVYNQRKVLGEYFLPVLIGCLVGSAVSLFGVLGLCKLMNLDQLMTMSLTPKSCTSAIAIAIAESHGGDAGLASAGVLAAGLTGAVLSPLFVKLFRIKDPVAQGLGIGACSHALGTTKAMELGEIQGAMSSIAICVCGIISSVLALFV
ncbi:MAG: LrgB family protein [Ruminococcaceae bacterium]|nr:LrgB family protein [Oscillospiraceae bacterium]